MSHAQHCRNPGCRVPGGRELVPTRHMQGYCLPCAKKLKREGLLTPARKGTSKLGVRIRREQDERRCRSLNDLSAMSDQADPYRLDTPSRHTEAAWLLDKVERLMPEGQKIHLRGLHYLLLGETKPDGKPYENTKVDYNWLNKSPGKFVRWLEYLPFDRIVDERNSQPMVHPFERDPVEVHVKTEPGVVLPGWDELLPGVWASGVASVQKYRLVLVAEKSSLESVLGPIAQEHEADLYLPSGELSDTLIYRMVADAHRDGRPMVAFYFSDCDPSGWQMPMTLSWKTQALRDLEFSGLEFKVHHVALTPQQVKAEELPQTMLGEEGAEESKGALKTGDRRRRLWRERMGVEQTEIDSLVAKRPDLLREMALDAIAPYFDSGLADRVQAEYDEWRDANQAALEAAVDWDKIVNLAERSANRVERIERELGKFQDSVDHEVGDFEPQGFASPAANPLEDFDGLPLGGSHFDMYEHAQRLKARKAYEADDDE
jgi:hypothetical protein